MSDSSDNSSIPAQLKQTSLSDAFRLVSQQSASRPGCVIHLNTIPDVTHVRVDGAAWVVVTVHAGMHSEDLGKCYGCADIMSSEVVLTGAKDHYSSGPWSRWASRCAREVPVLFIFKC